MLGSEQDISNHVNIAAAEEEDLNNIGEYSSDDEQIEDFIDNGRADTADKHQDIPDQDNLIEPSIQDETISPHSRNTNLDQDEDQSEYEQ